MTQQLTTDQPPQEDPLGWQAAITSWPDTAARAWTVGVVDSASIDALIEAVVATGSAVRDVGHSEDLDLVLVYRVNQPQLSKPPISIDLRQYEHDDVMRKLATGHDYLSWTVRFGQALFERDCWWTRLRNEWKDRLRLPSPAESLKRAQKAERLYRELRSIGDTDAAAELHVAMLTHLSWVALSEARVFPKSRPELANQLRGIGECELADRLVRALGERNSLAHTV